MKMSPRSKSLFWQGGPIVLLLIVLGIPTRGEPVPITGTSRTRSLVESNSAFALDLYRQFAKQPGNLFFSPHGISTSMAMAYAGARHQTARELAGTLHFGLPPVGVNGAFTELAERMDRVQQGQQLILTSSNSLWFQQDYRLADDFLAQIRRAYRAEVQPVDFKGNPQDASARINRWAAGASGGKIGDASRADQFSPASRLVLGNAIHFKGAWKKRFDPDLSSTRSFHVTTNTSVPVPMMHQHGRFKTTFGGKYLATILELPYSGEDLSMVILLPEISAVVSTADRFSMGAMEKTLSPEILNQWLRDLDESEPEEVDLRFPRFTLRTHTDLIPALKANGLTSIFDDHADLSGMDGTTNLFVTDVTHDAFVEVDEAGTEAAAVTMYHGLAKAGAFAVTVDHPFMFLIRDRASGSILFLGRIVDPSE